MLLTTQNSASWDVVWRTAVHNVLSALITMENMSNHLTETRKQHWVFWRSIGKEEILWSFMNTVFVLFTNPSKKTYLIATSSTALRLISCINFIKACSRTTLSNGAQQSLVRPSWTHDLRHCLHICYDFYSFTHSFSLNYTLNLIL